MIGKLVLTTTLAFLMLGDCHHAAASVVPATPGGWVCAGFAAPPLAGPPAICHPIDIGDARSLPWGGFLFWGQSERFNVDKSYARNDLERLVGDTLEILISSDDTFVHMETIRRAVIYMTGIGNAELSKGQAWADRTVNELVSKLKAGVVGELIAKDTNPERLALRWFDIGYLLAAYRQASHVGDSGGGEAYLARATELSPENGAMQLGFAIATYGHGTSGKNCYVLLNKAVALAEDPKGALRVNLMGTFGHFLGAKSYAELADKVAKQLERA